MKKSYSLLLLFSLVLQGTNYANATVLLPDPDCGFNSGSNCLVYDDFTVYSMSFLQFNLDGKLSPTANDVYYVASSPGKIKNDIVIATSPAAAKTNTDVANNVDNAFDTPNMPSGSSQSSMFAMMSSAEPLANGWTGDNVQQSSSLLSNPNNLDINGDGSGDGNLNGKLSLWDIQVSELTSFLNGDDLLFFFNLNERGNQETLDAGQDMLSWGTVYLTDTLTGSSIDFTFSGANTVNPLIQSMIQTVGVDNILPNVDDLWGYVHGEICVDNTNGAVLALSSCSAAGNPQNGETVKQNLGAKAAAFALWNENLNKALYSGSYDVMTVDLRMSHIDSGYDQLFIRAGHVGEPIVPEENVPEPGSIWLITAGLVGLSLYRRKTKFS